MEKVYNSLEKYYKPNGIMILKKYNSKKYFVEFLRDNKVNHLNTNMFYITQRHLKEMKESCLKWNNFNMNALKHETL